MSYAHTHHSPYTPPPPPHYYLSINQHPPPKKKQSVLLVQHLEDLDDILAAVRRLEPPIDRRSFRAAITEALGSARAMSQSNVDFLYHIFDRYY